MQGFIDEYAFFFIIFAFYAEIQDGHQKWWGMIFGNSADTLQVKYFIEIALSCICFRDKCIFVFYTEIQDDGKTIFGKTCQ